MKIAIYEPESMVGGLQTWAVHLRAGLRKLGHQADVITFTRSGKPHAVWAGSTGLKWRTVPYDVVGRYTKASDTIDQYDGIILNDPRSYLQDTAAERGRAVLDPHVPDYLTILQRAKCPVTVAVHCSHYVLGQFLYPKLLTNLPTHTGKVVAHSQRAFDEAAHIWPDWIPIVVPLPYEYNENVERDWFGKSTKHRVGITGRYTAVKGHRVLAAAAAYGDTLGVDTELWGGADIFAGPSATVNTYEQLIASGLTGTRETGAASASLPWSVERESNYIDYRGTYTDVWDVLKRLDVHVNLTTTGASGGALEYSQLEAINAGCLQIAPEHRWDNRYHGVVLPSVEKWPSDKKLRELGDSYEMLGKINDAVAELLLGQPRVKIDDHIEHNRDVLRQVHDPEVIAEAYVDALTPES